MGLLGAQQESTSQVEHRKRHPGDVWRWRSGWVEVLRASVPKIWGKSAFTQRVDFDSAGRGSGIPRNLVGPFAKFTTDCRLDENFNHHFYRPGRSTVATSFHTEPHSLAITTSHGHQ